MGHRECFDFGERSLPPDEIEKRDILEVGACMDGGSMRPYVESHGPSSYVGVDIQAGPGVDEICDAMDLLDRFGEASFDVIIANELLEHIREWRQFLHVVKHVLRPGGMLVMTTRSIGFPFHYAPFDFWRYEEDDMRQIFRDCEVLNVESDTRKVNGKVTPGVFVAVRKPEGFSEVDLTDYELYSIVKERRARDVSDLDILLCEFRSLGFGYFRKHRFVPYLMRDLLSRRVFRPLRARRARTAPD